MGYEKSGYRESDGIYDSLCPKVPVPRNVDVTTYCIFQQRDWNRIALVDATTGANVTYTELKTRILSVSSGLAQVGVKRGDVVMLCMPNSIHWPVLFFAMLRLGAVVTTANPVNSPKEITRQAEDSTSSYLVTVPELLEKLTHLNLPTVLNDIDGLGNAKPFNGAPLARLSGLLRADPNKVPQVKIRETDIATLLYSSGTTGTSKGVILTHLNLVAAVHQKVALNLDVWDPNVVEVHGIIIPLFHVMGLVALSLQLLRKGSQLVIFSKFDFAEMLGAIQRYRIGYLGLVPPILVLLAKSPLVDKYDLSSLKTIGFGAAPAGDVSTVSKRIKGVSLLQGYGLTESAASGSTVRLKDKDLPNVGNSCGHLLSDLQARIVDVTTGKSLPPNQEGELWLRGLCIMQGYWNNEEATAETLDQDGWLHTGDLARIDENGFMYIVDRLKELIKYKGFQVPPAELESILLSHRDIMDAAVVAFPDEEAGEIPVAFVVKRAGSSLTATNVMDFVANQVSPYKKIRRVVFVDAIPKLESGKILRRNLKDILGRTSKL